MGKIEHIKEAFIRNHPRRHSRFRGNDELRHNLLRGIDGDSITKLQRAGITLTWAISFLVLFSIWNSAGEPMKIWKSKLAGSWYSSDQRELKNRIGLYLERVGTVTLEKKPLAIIAPHAGYLYSGQCAAYSYKTLQGQPITRVVILGITHHFPMRGGFLTNMAGIETPLGVVKIDTAAQNELLKNPLFSIKPEVHEQEHSVEIQLPFLQMVLGNNFQIVPIAFGALNDADFDKAAESIKKIVDEKTLLVASSDFTHYGDRFGFIPSSKNIPSTIEKIDQAAIKPLLDLDPKGFLGACDRTGATICGRMSIGVLLHVLPKTARGTLLRYYRSGDISGDWSNSVSYTSILFTDGSSAAPAVTFENSEAELRQKEMLNPQEQAELVKIARQTVESYVREKKTPEESELGVKVTEGMKKKLGVFVTLNEDGQLRGCIGHIEGMEPLFKGVIDNAVNACAHDYRFKPVTPEELKRLDIEISVLSPLKPVPSYESILPGWHGVVLHKNGRQAVFLPQVAVEYGWDRDEMLTQLAQKAGLKGDDWRSGAQFFTFEAQIFSEER